jgi:hypothetical protein
VTRSLAIAGVAVLVLVALAVAMMLLPILVARMPRHSAL